MAVHAPPAAVLHRLQQVWLPDERSSERDRMNNAASQHAMVFSPTHRRQIISGNSTRLWLFLQLSSAYNCAIRMRTRDRVEQAYSPHRYMYKGGEEVRTRCCSPVEQQTPFAQLLYLSQHKTACAINVELQSQNGKEARLGVMTYSCDAVVATL